MYKLECRAECMRDVCEVITRVGHLINDVKISSVFLNGYNWISDVDVEFDSRIPLEELRQKIFGIHEKVGDLHVMYQSLNNASEYTGERYWEEQTN